MDEKEIQSVSLATLLGNRALRPGDLYYEGCLIALRVNMPDEYFDLFRYPTRLSAFAIVLCSHGSITFTAGMQHFTLGENTLFVHMPGSILQVESVEQGSAVYAILCEEEFIRRINIDFRLFSRLFLGVEEHPCLQMTAAEWDGFTHSFADISAEGAACDKSFYSGEIMRSILRTLSYKVCRVIDRHLAAEIHPQVSARSRSEEYFTQFTSELAKHYREQRSVGFYADQLHLTPKYLTTIIRKTTGRTAVKWIDDYVVLEAKNMLKYSTMSIQEIAYYLNFPNQSFFGKYFKNHTGVTPSTYRTSE